MKVNPAELAHVRSQGFYVTEGCDGCASLLNQAHRYTIPGEPEVYCSSICRDTEHCELLTKGKVLDGDISKFRGRNEKSKQ